MKSVIHTAVVLVALSCGVFARETSLKELRALARASIDQNEALASKAPEAIAHLNAEIETIDKSIKLHKSRQGAAAVVELQQRRAAVESQLKSLADAVALASNGSTEILCALAVRCLGEITSCELLMQTAAELKQNRVDLVKCARATNMRA